MKIIFALSALLLSTAAFAADPIVTDLPDAKPATSTGFVACHPGTGNAALVAAIVTFADGKMVRFDESHMHGLTVEQLIEYANLAPDVKVYNTCIKGATST